MGGSSGSFTGPNELAGAGGADAPECSRDVQCDNDLTCDGAERCVGGKCELSEALECAYGTHCVEGAAERCVYETSSPWLLAMTKERVMALRLADLAAGDTTMVPLAQEALDPDRHQAFGGFSRAFFSPNGQHAFVLSVEEQWGYSYQLARFGAGFPSLGDIPELPSWGEYEAPQFQADSSRARLVDDNSGNYVVDLTRDPVLTERQALDDDTWRTEGCSDGKSSVHLDDNDAVYIETVEAGITTTRELGEHYYDISPDGRFVLLTSDEYAEVPTVVLTHCSGDPWALELDDAFGGSFSPDLKLLWLKLNGGGQRVLSIEDPAAPVEIWESSEAEDIYGSRFTPDSRRLLFEAPVGENEPSLHVVDLSLAAPEAYDLGFAPGAELFYIGNAALLAIDSSQEGSVRYLWRSWSPTDPPQLAFERTTSQTSKFSSGFLEEGGFFIERGSDEQVELLQLQLAADGFELTSLGTFEGVDIGTVEIAPDHSGVLVGASTNFTDNKLYWIALSPEGEASQPILLLERASAFAFQRVKP